MSEATTISIVLPVRNMAEAIATIVTECMAVAGQHCADYEIILVDDGSDDGTYEQADHLAAAYDPVMVLHQPAQRGYAAALRAAWEVARGDYLLAFNPAGAAGIAELPRLLATMDDHAIVTGYRPQRPQTPLAPLYAAAVRAVLGSNLRDPALRYALFRADLIGLLPSNTPDGLAHAEIYARVQRAGLPVAQVAITGRHGQEPIPSAALVELARYRQAGGQPGSLVVGLAVIAGGGLWLLRKRRRR